MFVMDQGKDSCIVKKKKVSTLALLCDYENYVVHMSLLSCLYIHYSITKVKTYIKS